MSAPTTSRADRYAAKLNGTCLRGHALSDDNTYWRPTKDSELRRQCKQCRRDRQRVANQKAREAAHTPQVGTELMPATNNQPTILDISWHDRSACRNASGDGFFLHDDERGIPERVETAAYRYCAGCPVREQCDQQATHNRDHGLWGGKLRDIDPHTKRYRLRTLTRTHGSESLQ